MCGIVGLIAKYANGFYAADRDLFRDLLRIDSIRGEDSTGVFGITRGGEVDIVKGDADGYLFTKSADYYKFHGKIPNSYKIVIGHNRKATQGEIKPENAHPFHSGRIVLVHNGTLFNSDKEFEVDSQAIVAELNKHDAKKALENINGAFALVWYDIEDQTLNLARNDKRPLWIVEYKNSWVLSSEYGLPIWLQNRIGIKYESDPFQIPENKILRWSLKNLGVKPEELSFEEYKEPPVKIIENRHFPTITHHPKVPLFGTQRKSPQVGDLITFVIEDDRDEEHGGKRILGSPIFGNEKDENIIVAYPMLKDAFEKFEPVMYKHDFFEGRIRGTSVQQGVPIWYVENVTPKEVLVKCLTSLNGESFDIVEATEILRLGCPRCKGTIKLIDISNTIIKRKNDGDHRILCKFCIEKSASVAELKKKGENVVQVLH